MFFVWPRHSAFRVSIFRLCCAKFWQACVLGVPCSGTLWRPTFCNSPRIQTSIRAAGLADTSPALKCAPPCRVYCMARTGRERSPRDENLMRTTESDGVSQMQPRAEGFAPVGVMGVISTVWEAGSDLDPGLFYLISDLLACAHLIINMLYRRV